MAKSNDLIKIQENLKKINETSYGVDESALMDAIEESLNTDYFKKRIREDFAIISNELRKDQGNPELTKAYYNIMNIKRYVCDGHSFETDIREMIERKSNVKY